MIKRISVFKKILLFMLTVLLVNIVVVFAITSFQIENISKGNYAAELENNYEYSLKLINIALTSNNDQDINAAIQQYEKVYPYKIALIINGKITYGNFLSQEEYDKVEKGIQQGYINSNNKKYFFTIFKPKNIFIDIRNNGIIGSSSYKLYNPPAMPQIVIAKELPIISEQMIKIISLSLFAIISVSIPTLFILFLFLRKMTKPIIQISDAAEQIADGNYSEKVTVRSRDEIGDLANSINNMIDKLKENELARDAFIAGVSHELRTPLTTLKATTKGIIDGIIPKQETEKYLLSSVEEINRLTMMVNDLILASSFEQNNNITLEKVDLSQFILSVVNQMEILAAQKGVKLDCEIEPKLYKEIDKQKFKQVLINVLDNAIKYSSDVGIVKVKVKNLEGKISISIKDNGTGIEFEDPNKIFSRFCKSKKSSGLGLGMFISKLIITAHKGEITAKNNENGGATIEIIL